jgi:hypothetical protein
MRVRLDRLAGNAGLVFQNSARDRICTDDIADGVLRALDRLPERAVPTPFSTAFASSIIVATCRFADRRARCGDRPYAAVADAADAAGQRAVDRRRYR